MTDQIPDDYYGWYITGGEQRGATGRDPELTDEDLWAVLLGLGETKDDSKGE